MASFASPERPGVEALDLFIHAHPTEADGLVVAYAQDVIDTANLKSEPIAFPWQSPRDILRALHLLRC